MKRTKKHGKIAFITTPKYRETCPELVDFFIYRYMYGLCSHFAVMTTGRTTSYLKELLRRPLGAADTSSIEKDTGFPIRSESDFTRWREVVLRGLRPTMSGYPGVIHVAYELVEGRLSALIHLTDWEDKSAKPDSAVLSREANVHNVPSATDVDTAIAYVQAWRSILERTGGKGPLFRVRDRATNPPLRGLDRSHSVLAMVSHDNMKLEICRFAIENAAHIFRHYNYILATGNTGGWIQRFMEAAGRSPADVARIRLCNSGPKGGDLQIAYAVVKGICQDIIFFQDPSVSHPHDSDIRLFEQAVLHKDVKVRLATNVESARFLIGL